MIALPKHEELIYAFAMPGCNPLEYDAEYVPIRLAYALDPLILGRLSGIYGME